MASLFALNFISYFDTHAELATIVHDPAAHHPATPAQLESWDEQRQQGIAHQIYEGERRKGEDRPAAAASAASEAAAQQKRAERDARRRRLAEAAEDAGPVVVVEGAAAPTPPPSSATTDAPSSSSQVYTVSVPTTSGAFAWYAPAAHAYETLDAAREAGVWTYPATEGERARCEVFRDLWEKGYYLGGGGKFGGDWLVYPGALACFSFLPTSGLCQLSTCRRSAALSFSLCCDRADLPVCPITSDGDCGARSVGHGDEKGTSVVWMGPGEPRGHLHQRRVGRVRVVEHTQSSTILRILYVLRSYDVYNDAAVNDNHANENNNEEVD